MALNNWCWFYGEFSIMKGWRSFFFGPSLVYDDAHAGDPASIFPLYSATQMWIYSNSFSSIECPKKSGMVMNSSNVDKRTRLIPCRCASGLCEGTLCCPRSREKGESSMNYERKTAAQPSTAGYDCLDIGRRKEEPRNTHCSFHSLGELLVCRITWVYVCHAQSKNTITIVVVF